MFLTIGMPTYDDFDGVYFTLQALKSYHDLTDVELLVVDTKPKFCEDTKKVCESIGASFIIDLIVKEQHQLKMQYLNLQKASLLCV